MIAYDYDDETQEIYVHTGWRDENGKTLTHVSLNDLGYNILSDATVINLNYSYALLAIILNQMEQELHRQIIGYQEILS